VGATGWATGPHLHFEFRVKGVHQDPLTVLAQNEAVPVSISERERFGQVASASKAQLAAAASMRLVTTE
jgi:hypothetical protein